MKEIKKKTRIENRYNKLNILKEILYFYKELCVSENERNEKKQTKTLKHVYLTQTKFQNLIMKTHYQMFPYYKDCKEAANNMKKEKSLWWSAK